MSIVGLTVPVSPAEAQARPTLRLGSSGDAVLVLEQRLVELGYQVPVVDTSFDAETRSAVVTFQRAAGIGQDGIVGPITWGALDRGVQNPGQEPVPDPNPAPGGQRPTLRLGSSGDAVLVLEQRLVELGYQVPVVDTSFDAETRSAVVTFQRAAGIGQDGIVGPITWGALDRGVQNPNPTPAPGPAPDPSPSPDPTPDPDPVPAPGAPLLRPGASGPEVLALQQRLSALGYWVDSADGTFGSGTRHAVVALQKAAGLGRDGVVGPNTWGALDAGIRPRARTASGRAIEVDLTRQLLLVVDGGVVREIHDASTGRVAGTTPVGSWRVTRHIDGYRYAPLGVLYRPKYFYGGVAIHGYPSVPATAASHGCVRVTYPAMDHLWATGVAPIGGAVVVYR